MEILEQSPKLVVCHQSATYMRGFGLAFAGMGAGAFVLVSHANRANVHGSPFVAYVVGVLFMIAGLAMFVFAEDDRIVLDGAAQVARIIRHGLWRKSMTEVPFATIQDVALELSVASGTTNTAANTSRMTWRPVFVCANNARVPWTPMSTSDRISQAKAVAAARAVGGWNVLPVEGAPTLARAMTAAQNVGCLYGFAAMFILVGLLMMGVQVAPMTAWLPTTATVVSTDIATSRSNNGTSYRPEVTYQYAVNGAQYTSRRLAPLTVSASRGWAQSVIDRYPAGKTLTVWYDPKQPANAIIERRFSFLPLIMIGIMLLVVLLVAYNARRYQRNARAALTGGDVPIVRA